MLCEKLVSMYTDRFSSEISRKSVRAIRLDLLQRHSTVMLLAALSGLSLCSSVRCDLVAREHLPGTPNSDKGRLAACTLCRLFALRVLTLASSPRFERKVTTADTPENVLNDVERVVLYST